jgi:cytochrome c oxidase subunit I
MGVAPILVVFGAIYHWFPKVTGRMMNDTIGKLHFWITFLGTYAMFFPMHYLGIQGMPRRYYDYPNYEFISDAAYDLNTFITVIGALVAAAQVLFLWNLFWSAFRGRPSGGNPWRSTSLEWQTPETPPRHGNWGPELPVVHRWPYDYNVPDAPEDFVPQTHPRPTTPAPHGGVGPIADEPRERK